jgi:hypothetical protein
MTLTCASFNLQCTQTYCELHVKDPTGVEYILQTLNPSAEPLVGTVLGRIAGSFSQGQGGIHWHFEGRSGSIVG